MFRRSVFAFHVRGMERPFFTAHPKRYWPQMLALSAVLLVATLAFNIGVFLVYSRAIDAASISGFDITKVAIDRSKLSEVIMLLDARDTEFERVSNASVPSDPSL